MSRVPTVRKADLDRVLKALMDAGETIDRVEVKPSGEVVILTGKQSAPLTLVGGAKRRRGEPAAR
ncbi:MAG: hypothetical protein ACHP7N_15390 [Caulobacterales bacterium]